MLPTAAAYQHPERVVLRAAEWFEPLGGRGGGADGARPGVGRGPRHGGAWCGEPASSTSPADHPCTSRPC